MHVHTVAQSLVVLLAVSAIEANAQSHCAIGEATHFSCRIRNSSRTLSICGSDLRAVESLPRRSEAWLQYRFGAIGKPELVFPAAKNGSLDAFVHEYHMGLQQLSFSKSGATYTVFVAQNDITEEISKGVAVEINGKSQTLRCSDVEPSSTFFDLIYALEYPGAK